MDLQKAKILLGKINALYNSMSADAANIADIEKDLMRSYLRQMYDLFLDTSPVSGNHKTTPTPEVEVIRPANKPASRTTPPAEQPPAESVQVPPQPEKRAPKQEEYQSPRIIDLPDSLKGLTEEAPAPKQTVKPEPPAKKSPASGDESDELETLFDQPQAKELSDKLSELPISDLTKAMGLNEKVFTINELFAGDQEAFQSVMKTLNQFQTFDQAKDYLLQGAAQQYEWAAKDRKKKAKALIKLIRRRYS